MAVGQGVLGAAVLDVADLDRLGSAIEAREQRRTVDHAQQLVDALAMHRVYADAGMSISTGAHLALLLSCSENRAEHLLHDARVLAELGALPRMLEGLLTVEQARAVVDVLGLVDDALAASLWERLAGRLGADRAAGIVRPPARLRELLHRWLLATDPEGCEARRKDASQTDADVELWKRGDGLVDVVGRALDPADAIAVSDRIDTLAQPMGPDDQRTTGQRRKDAFRDLLLGRVALPLGDTTGEVCCPPGSGAPCGANIFVHVPVATAAADSTEPAELIGHGPIGPQLLADLLGNAPVLRRVWVDRDTGVPVAVDDHICTPGRDPAALSRALAHMCTGPPPDQRHAIHLDDHPPQQPDRTSSASPHPRVLRRPHLAGPGGYVPPRRLAQLLRVRAPRFEWPGCGRRACRAAGSPCDLDHDLAWPFGPTCACNVGPLCRRHHRIKQVGWTKHRQPNGSVRWTDPTFRSWTNPSQHPTPPPIRRQVAPGVWTLAA